MSDTAPRPLGLAVGARHPNWTDPAFQRTGLAVQVAASGIVLYAIMSDLT